VTCPSCGARNPPDAAWCTQCFARFGADDGAAAGGGLGHGERDRDEPLAASGNGTSMPGADAGVKASGGRDVRERSGVVEWRCRTCQSWNPLLAGSCAVCESPRRGFGTAASASSVRPAGNATIGASLVLPGLGHVLAGDVGTGLARAVLAVLWVGGGLAMVLSGEGAAATLPGWVLLGGAVLLWTATALDARRLVAGRPGQLLDTRRLGGLVVLVTGVLVVAVLLTSPVSA